MVIETDRLVATSAPERGDEVMDRAIRPRRLADYIGQRVEERDTSQMAKILA